MYQDDLPIKRCPITRLAYQRTCLAFGSNVKETADLRNFDTGLQRLKKSNLNHIILLRQITTTLNQLVWGCVSIQTTIWP